MQKFSEALKASDEITLATALKYLLEFSQTLGIYTFPALARRQAHLNFSSLSSILFRTVLRRPLELTSRDRRKNREHIHRAAAAGPYLFLYFELSSLFSPPFFFFFTSERAIFYASFGTSAAAAAMLLRLRNCAREINRPASFIFSSSDLAGNCVGPQRAQYNKRACER